MKASLFKFVRKIQKYKDKILGARPGFEPGTSCTLNKNHTPRPTSRDISSSCRLKTNSQKSGGPTPTPTPSLFVSSDRSESHRPPFSLLLREGLLTCRRLLLLQAKKLKMEKGNRKEGMKGKCN